MIADPFRAPGHMVTPYPDYRHYTARDYGNRVGVWRFLEAFEKAGVRASYAVNAAVAERYPQLIEAIVGGGVVTTAAIPFWVLLVGALGISLGLALYGPKLIRTVGSEITELDKIRAFCIAMALLYTRLNPSSKLIP